MTRALGQIRHERASDQVFRALRDSILTQAFAPGERLNIDDLAAGLGVSLTPVKDAITRLAAEGLVDVRPRSGTFVAELTPDDVAETFEVREALEALAAERALLRLTPDAAQRIRAIVDRMDRPVANERERLAHERLNGELHSALVELSGNRRLQQLYASLNAHIRIARVHHSRQDWAERLAAERVEHRAIVDALEARDSRRLVKAIRDHIRRASASLVNDLRHRPPRAAADGLRPGDAPAPRTARRETRRPRAGRR